MASAFQSRWRSREIFQPDGADDNCPPVSILLVEDDPTDVYLLRRSLKREAGERFKIVVFDRLQPAIQWLEQGDDLQSIEVILLDLGLPDSYGIATVQEMSSHVSQIPIVVLTGLEDDWTGRQALRFGAQDYLCKNNLRPQGLVKALDYAIERQQTLERLRASQTHLANQETFLRSVMNASPTLMAVKDQMGLYVVVNDALAAFYGTTPERMIGSSEADVSGNPTQARFHRQEEQKICQDGQERELEQEPYKDPEGTVRWFHSVRRPLRNQRGEIEWVLIVMTDVTVRQEAEHYLWQQAERARLLGQLTHQIRESLQLPEILQTAARQVRQFLHVDRVMIYSLPAQGGAWRLNTMDCDAVCQLGEDGGAGLVPIYEFLSWSQGTARAGQFYDVVGLRSPAEIAEAIEHCAETVECCAAQALIDQTETLKVRSLLVVPILKGEYFLRHPIDMEGRLQMEERLESDKGLAPLMPQFWDQLDESRGAGEAISPSGASARDGLWGILVAHHCVEERSWPQWKQDFLRNLSAQLAIAIQQATLYSHVRKVNQRLGQLATMDGLTGIPNRRLFDQTLQKEWKRSRRTLEPLALIVGDIDFFKAYNDHYGHLAGDDCLQQVAQMLARVAKRSTDLAFRYGGEEFAIILPETALEGAIAVAQQVLDTLWALALEHEYSGVAQQVTLSLGVTSLIPKHHYQPGTLIQRADQALFVAKEAGRNRAIALNADLDDIQPVKVLTPHPTPEV